jgi:hypothetical protein
MLQGHVFDSFTKPELRSGGAFTLSQFVGGMPPAIFLFLTGATLAFLMDSTERKGFSPWSRVRTAFSRSRYLFFLAFAFRIQMFLFAYPAPWQDLFRVDVLNAMGFAMAVFAGLAALTTRQRLRWAMILGLGIAFASPVVSQFNLAALPAYVRGYIVPDYHSFGLFPWGAYLAFGIGAGSAIRVIPPEGIERAMQWCAVGAFGTLFACRYFAELPYGIYQSSEYWLNSPAQVLGKTSVVLLLLCLAFVWTRYVSTGWSWIRQLGVTSLLVYWVHIELIYGRWFWFLKNNLTVGQVLAASVLLIPFMVGLSVAWSNRARIQAALIDMGWWFLPKPDRVPGD